MIKAFAFQGLTQRMDYSPLLQPPHFRCSERRLCRTIVMYFGVTLRIVWHTILRDNWLTGWICFD
jgi:fatty acid desaturase